MPLSRAALTSESKSAKVPSLGWMALWPPSGEPIAQGLPSSSGLVETVLLGPLAKAR